MRATLFPLTLVGALAVTACTSIDTQTDDENRRTKEGAIAGGIAGAIAGAIAGDDTKSVLIGAAVGAGGGALIGADLDRQAAELEASLGDQVRIVNTGDELIVTMPQDILFAVDSASVSPSLTGDLQTLAYSLNDYPNTTVDVIGHTDSDGSASYNQALSSDRASSVASILLNNGVASSRVRYYGRGEDAPLASNLTEEGKAQNRRVEIIIRPIV